MSDIVKAKQAAAGTGKPVTKTPKSRGRMPFPPEKAGQL
jgi:hypothetical protein